MPHSEFYARYMRSTAWHRRRAKALKRAEYRCEYEEHNRRCWVHSKLQVHHKNYKNLGHEKQADLQVLCEDHHAVAELLKIIKGLEPAFADAQTALEFWKRYKRKHPKDWAHALEAAKAAAKNDKGRGAT